MLKVGRRFTILFLAIFLLSLGLRGGMIYFNRQANDDHMQVISLILESGTLPDKSDCWECFQPKLFHYTAANILQNSGADKLSQDSMILAVELINLVAGMITLVFIGLLITRLPVKSETLKLLSFGLIALNPGLIGINSQATNDTFVILFSTLALYYTILFLQEQKLLTFLLTLLFSLLCIASKANGWVTAIAITLALLIKAWTQKKQSIVPWLTGFVFITAVLVFSFINPLNQYVLNLQKFGTPLTMNVDPKSRPSFITKTQKLCGIRSVLDAYFTFKFASLIQHPRIEYTGDVRPDNCTSLWAVLYGRALSIHYDNFPPSWSTSGDQGFNLTRAIFILELPPTLLLLFGLVLESVACLKSILKRDPVPGSTTHCGLIAITLIGFIVFLCLFLFSFINLAIMKAIFIFPALLTFALLFMCAVEFIDAHLKNRFRWIRPVFVAWILILLVLNAADILTMIQLIASRTVGL